MLEFGYNTTLTIAEPFMGKKNLSTYTSLKWFMYLDLLGVDDEMKDFIFGLYLPLLEEHIGHIKLTVLEKAELLENTIGTVAKLLYGFVWQEEVIDFGGL